jgi:hypothetical protein
VDHTLERVHCQHHGCHHPYVRHAGLAPKQGQRTSIPARCPELQ